jgi:hypothetical protein
MSNFVDWLEQVFHTNRYCSELEKYIVAGDPKFPADVERLTVEYSQKQNRNFYKL